jgi:hypothetical protein
MNKSGAGAAVRQGKVPETEELFAGALAKSHSCGGEATAHGERGLTSGIFPVLLPLDPGIHHGGHRQSMADEGGKLAPQRPLIGRMPARLEGVSISPRCSTLWVVRPASR